MTQFLMEVQSRQKSEIEQWFGAVLFDLWFYVPVNNYGRLTQPHWAVGNNFPIP